MPVNGHDAIASTCLDTDAPPAAPDGRSSLPLVDGFRYTVAMADVPAKEPRPRWYRLTPERVVLGLLALEGLLLLSERFEWFAFNRHKGWAVLICLATVGAAFVLMFLWFLAALVFRWRFQFSIRSLLVLTVVVAIPCSWFATAREQARKQREAVEQITKAGGIAMYNYRVDSSGRWMPRSIPPGPPWLCKLLGKDLFANVTDVHFTDVHFFDSGASDARAGTPQRIAPTSQTVLQSRPRSAAPG